MTDTHRVLWHTSTMCPPKHVPGTTTASPPSGPKAFASRQSHATESQPSAQNDMSKKQTDTGLPCHPQQRILCCDTTRCHLRTLPFLGVKRKTRWMRVQQELARPEPSLPGQGRGRRPRPAGSPERPGTAAPGRARDGRGGTPPPPREEPLTWRVISDLIFCMMAPPPPRLRSAAAQGAGARRSHVGRHLTAPARGSLGAVVPRRPPDYKPRQRGREGPGGALTVSGHGG